LRWRERRGVKYVVGVARNRGLLAQAAPCKPKAVMSPFAGYGGERDGGMANDERT